MDDNITKEFIEKIGENIGHTKTKNLFNNCDIKIKNKKITINAPSPFSENRIKEYQKQIIGVINKITKIPYKKILIDYSDKQTVIRNKLPQTKSYYRKKYQQYLEKENFVSKLSKKYEFSNPEAERYYDLITKKIQPIANELLERKRFRETFKKFRERKKFSQQSTNQQAFKWHRADDKKLEDEISLFLDQVIKDHNDLISQKWKNHLRNYLFLNYLSLPVNPIIFDEKKGEINISFNRKDFCKSDVINFLKRKLTKIEIEQNKINKKNSTDLIRFIIYLKKQKKLSTKESCIIADIKNINEKSIERQIRRYKERYK